MGLLLARKYKCSQSVEHGDSIEVIQVCQWFVEEKAATQCVSTHKEEGERKILTLSRAEDLRLNGVFLEQAFEFKRRVNANRAEDSVHLHSLEQLAYRGADGFNKSRPVVLALRLDALINLVDSRKLLLYGIDIPSDSRSLLRD